MHNKYLSYITDDHFLKCIDNLHSSYLKTKEKKYFKKIDPIKFSFETKFNKIDEESIIETEVLHQFGKAINNSIGSFHEQILGGIDGIETGSLSGFDIKAKDNTLFAIFGTQDLPKNISDPVFEKLANAARVFLNAKLYYILLDDTSETFEKWVIGHKEFSVSQKRVFKISLKRFYTEITGQEDAYEELCNKFPLALESYLSIQRPF